MSLEGVDPPQGNKIIRALNRGGGFPQLQLTPPQGLQGGGIIPPAFINMLFEDGNTMLYEDIGIMAYEAGSGIPADWFDTDFKHRLPFTVKAGAIVSAGTELNFQTLIDGTFSEMIGNVQAEGQDIRFAGVDKVELKYEIESFDNTTGKLTAWFNSPTITDGDIIYMYYANPTAIDAQDKTAVWINNNAATWHMNQTTFGANTTLDSSANANNFTPANMDITNQVDGKIDGSLFFNGTNEDTGGPSTNLDNDLIDDFSIFAWINQTALIGSTRAILARLGRFDCGISTNGTQIYMIIVGGGFFPMNVSPPIVAGTDRQIGFTISPAAAGKVIVTFYIDGIAQGFLESNTPIAGTGNWFIGMNGAAGAAFNGVISSEKLYNKELTEDRIATNFKNENANQTTFFDKGIEETIS